LTYRFEVHMIMPRLDSAADTGEAALCPVVDNLIFDARV
jgi:hypothetical protein